MPARPFCRRQAWHLASAAMVMAAAAAMVMAAAAAMVMTIAAGALAQSPRDVRYRATISAADAKSISLITRAGQQLTMALASDTVIRAVVPFKLEDIAPGSYIGTGAMPQPDGTQRALEVHVFPESMRGVGEGHRPFDLEPRSTMTNGTVGTVKSGKGRTLTLHYQGGEKIIVVPPDTPVVTYEPGSPALLVAGAYCIVSGTEASDGKLTATRIVVGKDGLVPPM